MKREQTAETKWLPEDQVIVKIAKCPKCNGLVTAAVKHMMTKKDIADMGKEAIKYNLIIEDMPLLEYRKGTTWCICM